MTAPQAVRHDVHVGHLYEDVGYSAASGIQAARPSAPASGKVQRLAWLAATVVLSALTGSGCVYTDPARAGEALRARGITPTWVQPLDESLPGNRPKCADRYRSCTEFVTRGERGEVVHGLVLCASEGACDVVIEVPLTNSADGGR